MEDSIFENLVKEAIEEVPAEYKEKLENVEIVIADFPNNNQLRHIHEGNGKLLLGLYEGVPRIKRGRYGIGGTLPDKITIFKNPLLMIARSEEHLRELIADTVKHEIGHHFGMSEDALRKIKQPF